jgi:hypothetical protein
VIQNYDLETKCSVEAKAYLREEWPPSKTSELLGYTNHYNRSLTKCLIVVRNRLFVDTTAWIVAITLSDVHERTDYAYFQEEHTGTSSRLTTCSVGDKSCNSQQDFENLIKPYISN